MAEVNYEGIAKAMGAVDYEAVGTAMGGKVDATSPTKPDMSFATSLKQELAGRSGFEKALAGAGAAFDDAAYRLKQLFGNKLDAKEVARILQNRELIDQSGHALAGNIGANVAATAIPAAGAYNAISGAVRGALPLLGGTVAGATVGATQAGLTQPVLQGESTAKNIGVGAAGGAIGDAVARGAARAVQPIMQSPAVRTLLGEGVAPTAGQAAGANSIWGKTEQRLQSIPIIGDIITNSRQRATNEFNAAAINRSLPAAERGTVQGVGRQAIERTDQILSNGYNQVLDQIGHVQVSPQFLAQATAVVRDPDLALPPNVQQRVIDIVQTQILNRTPANNIMSAQLAKRADANIGQIIREYSGSQDGDQRAFARGLRVIQQSWRDNIVASATPEAAASLNELNRAFANFVRVERAAGYAGAHSGGNTGVFTAAQLQNAVRATDSSTRHGNFAQGRALMQDLSDAGVSTLSQTVGDSGTAGRLMASAILGGGAEASHRYFGTPEYLAALALAPFLYGRAGSRYMVGDLIPGQQAGAAAVRNLAPYAAQAGSTIAEQRQRQ